MIRAQPVPVSKGLAPNAGSGKSGTSHACGRVEIAANNGHNRASFKMSPIMNTLVFENFKPGRLGSFGPRRVTREEILAFAAEFDPQPMHLDEEAASRSMLKGLSGSGWHLCSIIMRMMFDGFIGRTASLGSPGVNDLRWLAPLRPGDELMLDVDVAEARVSRLPRRSTRRPPRRTPQRRRQPR